jgi:hypothetical protein
VTRAQRRAHAIVFPVLAALLAAAIGWALVRRAVVVTVEPASLGRVAPHDAEGSP